MVSIEMIARACGVSADTVERALEKGAGVSADTAARVRRIAAQMGYRADSARAQKANRSHCFGIVYEEAMRFGLEHEYFTRMFNSFVTTAEKNGYDVFLLGDRLAGRALSYAEHARYRSCDGVFIISGMDSIELVASELVTLNRPVVCVDYEFEGFGSVVSDNARGMRDLVTYVWGQGHRRIAFIHGTESRATRLRLESFARTCAELGLRVPGEYVVPGRFHDADSAAEAVGFLMSLSNPPTCILYPDDFAHVGGLGALMRRGLRAPEDVSVAGYDGTNLGQSFRPRLTSLRQDAEGMGRAAAQMLVDNAEATPPFNLKTAVLPGALIPGETVARIVL